MVVPCEENPLPVEEVEIDEFQFHYTSSEKPHIQNVRSQHKAEGFDSGMLIHVMAGFTQERSLM